MKRNSRRRQRMTGAMTQSKKMALSDKEKPSIKSMERCKKWRESRTSVILGGASHSAASFNDE